MSNKVGLTPSLSVSPHTSTFLARAHNPTRHPHHNTTTPQLTTRHVTPTQIPPFPLVGKIDENVNTAVEYSKPIVLITHPPGYKIHPHPATQKPQALSSPRSLHISHSSPNPPRFLYPPRGLRLELALSQEPDSDSDSSNHRLVLTLYDALSSRDVATVHTIVAADLEWWFHGPPTHQFLMRMLTGEKNDESFVFRPQSVCSVGPVVLVEGSDPAKEISWVHAWTVTDGIVTQVREYFNTSLTVTRLGNSTTKSSKISKSTAEITSYHCPSVWESSNPVGKSVPGLVLAI